MTEQQSNSFVMQDDSISVAVRIRPLNEREKKQNAKEILSIDQENKNKIWLDCKPESKSFIFDSIINSSVSQEEIFEIIGKRQADFCLKGYNSSIFAYGQTGAGKTYTMLGKSGESRGLQPRVFEYLFSKLEKFESSRVKCSYLEIYNEQIMDLLSSSGTTLSVREDQKKGVYIEGLSEEKVTSSQQAIELLNTGARNRHVSSTQMNFESSRSHSLFSLTIETKDKDEDGLDKIKCSKFHFIDLAGSERQNLTGAAGQTLKEASNINKSLTVLGCVINSLVEQNQGKQRHIPYRDSKLTFILKDSLGGNSKTCIIAAISDASIAFQETLSTLKFVQRAKMIKNKAQINEENGVNDVRTLRLEIKQLKDKLESMREAEINFEKQLKDTIQEKDDQTVLDLKERLQKLNEESILSEEEFAKNIHILKEQQQNEIQKYEHILNEMKNELSKQFTSDVQQQIIINSQQIRLKMLLEKTFPNQKNHTEKDFQFIKDTEHLLDDLEGKMNIENNPNDIKPESDQQNNQEPMNIEEEQGQEKQRTPEERDTFFLICLNNLIGKIDQSINSRKDFSETLKKMGLEGEWNTPEKMRACESSIDSLRDQYTGQIAHSQEQIKQLREERSLAYQEIQTLRNYLTQNEEELCMKNRELSKMDIKYRELISQKRDENYQRETTQMIEFEEKIIFLEEEKVKLQKELARQKLEREAEKLELNNFRKENEQMQQALEIEIGKFCIAEEEIKILNKRIKELEFKELNQQFRLNNMDNELQEFIQQNTLMLEEAQKWQRIEMSNDDLTKRLEEAQSEIAKLTDQNEILADSNTYLQNQMEEKLNKTQEQSSEVQKYKDIISDLNKRNQSQKESYTRLQTSFENFKSDRDHAELLEQNKSLFRRCDEQVLTIDLLTKERDFLKLQVSRKQDQASKFQLKISELQVSQKNFAGALRDAQEKLSQAQARQTTIKVKNKYVKKAEKYVAEAEAKLQYKELEMEYLTMIYDERMEKSNDLCRLLNTSLDDNDKIREQMNRIQSERAVLTEQNNRLVEANQNISKDKVNLIARNKQVETELIEINFKYNKLQEGYNNLILQVKSLSNENVNLIKQKNEQPKGPTKQDIEIQVKNDKITDLQNAIEKYSAQIRQQDIEIISLKKDLEASQKQIQSNLITAHTAHDQQARIDQLLELICQFEQHCGFASDIIEQIDIEKQEMGNEIESLREKIRSIKTNYHLSSLSNKSYEHEKNSKKAEKYKRKLTELKERNMQMINQYEEQINKLKMNEEEYNAQKQRLEEKEIVTKRYSEMSEDLSLKLAMANKKIASQMEHIQFQLKCYEEDKKTFRVDYQKSIANLEKQIDEKNRIIAQKQLRMEYFENLHKQIAEALDKNNAVYNQNVQIIKEKDRKLSYATKLQQEVLTQINTILHKNPFSKLSVEQLLYQLTKVYEYIDQRRVAAEDKENINTINIVDNYQQTPSMKYNHSVVKSNPTPITTQYAQQYQNLNLSSAMVNKEVEEFGKNLDKIIFGDDLSKQIHMNQEHHPLPLPPPHPQPQLHPHCPM